MPVTGGQAVVELPGEGKQLLITEAEVLPDSLQHGIHNQPHRVGKGRVGQFIHHHQEQLADGPVILAAALLQGEQHVADENKRHMGVQRVVGQAVALGAQMQQGLAGLEEYLDVPALAVDPQDFLRLQADICADEGDPVLAVIAVAHADDPRRNGVSLTVCQRDVDGQQILGSPAPLLARGKDLLDVHPPAVQLVEHLGGLLDHRDAVQLALPADPQDGLRRSKPGVEQDILRAVPGPERGLQHLHHDIRGPAGCLPPALSGQGTLVRFLLWTDDLLVVAGGQKPPGDREKAVPVRPAQGQQTVSPAVLHGHMVEHL